MSYQDYKDKLKAEQANKSYEEIKETMQRRSDFMLELDNLPQQKHNFVDRGALFSCEGAGHPNHHVYKQR